MLWGLNRGLAGHALDLLPALDRVEAPAHATSQTHERLQRWTPRTFIAPDHRCSLDQAAVRQRGDGAAEQRITFRALGDHHRSEEHTSELQSLMRISYAVFCLKKK